MGPNPSDDGASVGHTTACTSTFERLIGLCTEIAHVSSIRETVIEDRVASIHNTVIDDCVPSFRDIVNEDFDSWIREMVHDDFSGLPYFCYSIRQVVNEDSIGLTENHETRHRVAGSSDRV